VCGQREQDEAIMRTDSTRTRCAELFEPLGLDVALADEPALELELDAELLDSILPRISTSWFACWRSSLLSPSRTYVEPLVPLVALVLEPVVLVPVVDPVAGDELAPLPIFAFVNTNALALAVELAELGEPAVDPVVPTAPPIWLPCCKQPESVIVSALLLVLRLVCWPVVAVD
jgi:hypothetical protein